MSENIPPITRIISETLPNHSLPDFADRFGYGSDDTGLGKIVRDGMFFHGPKTSERIFIPKVNLALGKLASQHEVKFYQYRCNDCVFDVAVKGSTNTSQILHELAALQFTSRKTPFSTFEPVGYAQQQGVGYLVTKYRQGIQTMDVFDVGPLNREERYQQIARFAKSIGEMHALFLIHGDLQARNIAFDIETEDFAVIDLEYARYIKGICDKLLFLPKEVRSSRTDYVSLRRNMSVDLHNFTTAMLPLAAPADQYNEALAKYGLIKKRIFKHYEYGLLNNCESSYFELFEQLFTDIKTTWHEWAKNETL